MRAPLAPPRKSLPRKVHADAQAAFTSCGIDKPESSTRDLSAFTSAASMIGWSAGGIGSCQIRSSCGTSLPR